jgi:hypothetical protein
VAGRQAESAGPDRPSVSEDRGRTLSAQGSDLRQWESVTYLAILAKTFRLVELRGLEPLTPLLAKIVRPASRPAPLLVGAMSASPRVTVIDR